MRRIGLGLMLLAGIFSIGAGVRYMLAGEFMPYHAVVAGKSWAQLEPGIQTIVTGMLRIVGGGFAACGVALLWLLVPLSRGERWARWAALTTAMTVWIPTQYVTLMLKNAAPQAQPPIVPTVIMLGLVVMATAAMYAAKRDTSGRAAR